MSFPFPLGPGPVRPALVPGLALWLDAADPGTLLSDVGTLATPGTAVRQWSDKGPNGTPATQAATAPRPVYTTVGGLPAVQFDGVDDALTVAAPGLLAGAPGATAFLVLRSAAVPSGYVRPLLIGTPSGTTGFSVNRAATDLPQTNARRRDADGIATVTAGSASVPNAIDVECHFLDLASNSAGIRRNGSDVASVANVLTVGAFDATGSSTVCVGSNGGGNVLAGALHELIVFARALSPGERLSVERALRAKWRTA